MSQKTNYTDDHFNYPAFTKHRDNAPAFWSNDILWIMLATAQDTNGVFSVMEQLCAEKSGPPWHYHATQDETFYVLEGSIDFYTDGKVLKAEAGAFISIPKGTAHRFTVTSNSARVLNSYYPAGFEQVIIGTSLPAEALTLPPSNLPPVDMEKGVQLAKEHGMVFLNEEQLLNAINPNAPKPFMIYRTDVEGYWAVGILWLIMAKYEQTEGNHCFIDELIPQGPSAPPHRHEGAEEIFYIIDGEATFFAGKELKPLKAIPGSLVVIPKGITHAFQIDSPSVHLVNAYTPAGFEYTIYPASVPATALTLQPKDLAPINMQKAALGIAEVGEQFPGAVTTVFSKDYLNQSEVSKTFAK